MPQSGSVIKLVTALGKAQTGFTVVKKSKTGQEGNRSFKYADLADVLNMLTPVLNGQGIFLSHPLVLGEDGHLRQTTKVQLEDEFIQSDGIKLSVKEGAGKQLGIEVTYARRIDNNAFFGIFPDDDLDAPDLVSGDKPPLKVQGNAPQPSKLQPNVKPQPVPVSGKEVNPRGLTSVLEKQHEKFLPPVKSPEELAAAVALRNTEITDADLPVMDTPLPASDPLPEDAERAAIQMEDHITKPRYDEIQTILKDIVASKACSQRAMIVFLESRHGQNKGFYVPSSQWEKTIKEIEDAKASGQDALKKLLTVAGAK